MWVPAVEGSSTWSVEVAEDRTLVAVGRGMVGKAARGLQFRGSAGEEYHAGLDAKGVEYGDTATDRVDT